MLWLALFFGVSLIGLLIASYTDLKQRMVYNKLSYPLIAIGLVGHLAWAVIESNPMIFAYSALATIFGFAFAYLLWKLGVWAGGDVKLFTGLAALNPINPNIASFLGFSIAGITQAIQLPAFPISLFIFSVFAMLPYGILISIHGLTKREKERKELYLDARKKVKQTIQLGLAVVGFAWILAFFGITQWLIIPILLVLGLIKNTKIRVGVEVIVFAIALFNKPLESVTEFAILFALFFGLYVLIKLYSVSKKMLRERKKITELEDGDIIADSFIERQGQIVKAQPLEIKRIINYLTSNNLQGLREYLKPNGRVIASSRMARGVVEKEMEELKELVKEKKIEDEIEVKLSAPFVPALLIAYLALNVVGDAIWILIF